MSPSNASDGENGFLCQLCLEECDDARRCGGCGAIYYCSARHQECHWRSGHREECERLAGQMSRAEELCNFPFSFSDEVTAEVQAGHVGICSFLMRRGLHVRGIWRAQCDCSYSACQLYGTLDPGDDWSLSLPPLPSPGEPANSVPHQPLGSWRQYYSWRSLPLSSPAALVLHTVLTIYHALQLTSSWPAPCRARAPTPGSCHVIHIIGVEREVDEVAALRELLVLLPGVSFDLHLVGPAVPCARDGEILPLVLLPGSQSPTAAQEDEGADVSGQSGCASWLKVTLWKGLYHQVHGRLPPQGAPPDLVIAPNAGLAAFPEWLPTLELVRERKLVAVFSDFCEEAALMAAQVLQAVAGRTKLLMEVTSNPFRRPFLTKMKDRSLPAFSNGFLFG